MGRWTPLILMAGGLAILLGTLLGISFPMDGQNTANLPRTQRAGVLPANINVNSTATRGDTATDNNGSVAQNNTPNEPTSTDNTPNSTTTDSQSTDTPSTDTNSGGPIRALW